MTGEILCTEDVHPRHTRFGFITDWLSLNFGIKDKGSIRKLSEVKASVNLNQSLFKFSEGQILMSAENHDKAKQFLCRQLLSFYSIY